MNTRIRLGVAVALVSAAVAGFFPMAAAQAADVEVRIARQFGIGYLPTMVMEQKKLLEKYAKKRGVDNVKTKWIQLSNAASMNDALLSGNLDFASGALTAAIISWDKTAGSPSELRAVSGESVIPFTLFTNNPRIKSIRDFKAGDQIALPAVKVTTYAILLQMEAAKEFGEKNFNKLDPLTVSMAHPDAMQALFSKQITAHFTWPPYAYAEAEHAGNHKVLDSTQILDGQPMSSTVIWGRKKFHDEHPQVYLAFVDAMREAIAYIKNNKAAAAKIYKEQTHSKEPIEAILNDPHVTFDLAPHDTMKFATFLHKIGTIKHQPASWKDVFFPEAHDLDGS